MSRGFRGPIGFAICVGVGSFAAAVGVRSQALAQPTFTAVQAQRGEASYMSKCVSCHGDDLSNGEFGTPLRGSAFSEQWGGKSLDQLFSYMSSQMPPDNPGTLSAATYADILSFILSKNGVVASSHEMPADAEKLKRMAAPTGDLRVIESPAGSGK